MGIRFSPDEPSGRTEPGFVTRAWQRLRSADPPPTEPPPTDLPPSARSESPESASAARRLTADDVVAVRFSASNFREGYDQAEVDAFLDQVVATLRERAAGRPGSLTGTDVVNIFFQPTRFRAGYDQGEVDDFLDRVVETLA